MENKFFGTRLMASGSEICVEQLSVEQLKDVKKQTDLEVNLLQDSLNNIRTATAHLEIASTGKKMLVLLTTSLYITRTLDDADNVLVDVGTSYFIEKKMVEGKDYCERKINLLRSNFDQLVEVVVATETSGALGGMVRQLSIDQFQNKDRKVSYGTPESSTTARKLLDWQMSINNVPKKVFWIIHL
ncbi:hypothetical protein UlMin_019517 [Ulmus minor]